MGVPLMAWLGYGLANSHGGLAIDLSISGNVAMDSVGRLFEQKALAATILEVGVRSVPIGPLRSPVT